MQQYKQKQKPAHVFAGGPDPLQTLTWEKLTILGNMCWLWQMEKECCPRGGYDRRKRTHGKSFALSTNSSPVITSKYRQLVDTADI